MAAEASKATRSSPARRTWTWPFTAIVVLVLTAMVSGAALGYFMRFDLPDVHALEDYKPPVMTRVMADDGTLLDSFFEQRRVMIEYHDIPQNFINALLAAEDSNFHRHTGIDIKGVARAAWADLRSLRKAEGASTLTQQLARNLFLHRDKTFRRKLQEATLALEIERQYTKQEILGFYCNEVYMGHGRYGLEAAARFYYEIPARELSLTQAATLAGLLQRPEALSPRKHPDRALDRRNHVLRRMAEVGYLKAEEAREAQSAPLDTGTRTKKLKMAPFFVEDVRRWLQKEYGSTSLYTAGLQVRTTLDPELQVIAERAVESGLRHLDRRQGWRGIDRHVPDDEDPGSWTSLDWQDQPGEGVVQDGVVLSVDDEQAVVRVGPYLGTLGPEEVKWTRNKTPADFLKRGDILRVSLVSIAEDDTATLRLEQEPLVEAALVVLDPSTGAVRALVGGFDFERSEFDRAIQARRQTGSAFKPFVYAAALASGRTLADTLLDEPTVFLDPRKPVPYQPENYKNRYYGILTLRTAMEKSANIATVKLLDQIGYQPVIEMARRLGIQSVLKPFPSLGLGVFETSLLELTAAYGALSNQGVLVEPHFVHDVFDQDGGLVTRIEPAVSDAVNPRIAYLMNRLLKGVITDGTGRAAARLGLDLAGKTGTTDENTDAWFIGYAPGLAVGVWVGFDERRTLGKKVTGAVAALPIWSAFMENAFAGRERLEPFPRPPGITVVSIDRRTGLRADPKAYCNPVISEAFISGTEPSRYCSVYEHQRLRLPHPFQHYALGEHGEIEVPADELERLLDSELNVLVSDGGRRLEVHLPNEIISIALKILPSMGVPGKPDPRLEEFEVESWVGKDGRQARVVWMQGAGRSIAGQR